MGKEHDWFSQEAMAGYFLQLYSRTQSFDKKDMKHYLYKMDSQHQCIMFETAAQEFQLIDDTTTSVIVNWRNSLSLLEQLKINGPSYSLMKRLSQYSVNLRRHNLEQMIKEGIAEEVIDGIYVAKSRRQYNEYVGLLSENQWLEETYVI